MDTFTIVCLGVALTVVLLSVFSTLRLLSQVSDQDDQMRELFKNKKEDHE